MPAKKRSITIYVIRILFAMMTIALESSKIGPLFCHKIYEQTASVEKDGVELATQIQWKALGDEHKNGTNRTR